MQELLSKTSLKYDESDRASFAVLSYIYGILHSQKYREANKEFLKIDFPKIPKPSSTEEFIRIAKLGGELAQLHLNMKEVDDNVLFVGNDRRVNRVKYIDGRLYINESSYFDGVSETDWKYEIGSYCPIQHWLKDRKNRSLSDDNLMTVKQIASTVHKTIEITQQIDSSNN